MRAKPVLKPLHLLQILRLGKEDRPAGSTPCCRRGREHRRRRDRRRKSGKAREFQSGLFWEDSEVVLDMVSYLLMNLVRRSSILRFTLLAQFCQDLGEGNWPKQLSRRVKIVEHLNHNQRHPEPDKQEYGEL